MAKVLILVEGQTESEFVDLVLAPYLEEFKVYAIPTILVTKWVKAGNHFRGGVTSYAKVAADVRRLLRDTNAALVTTMIDYYGLPANFPGLDSRPNGDCYARVAHVEDAFRKDISHNRFMPYLSLHEFESLIFTAPEECSFVFAGTDAAARLQKIADGYGSPEEINEGRDTAPSKRILAVFPQYQKILHGQTATREIGLTQLRAKCPHFSKWVERLEKA